MEFSNLDKKSDQRTVTFTLTPLHVTYANTLRRLILTGVETIAFRADMTSMGTTTDVIVKRNDTPMTNEMLAARIGLLPIHITDPQKWKENEYQFHLSVAGHSDLVRHVTCSDFEVVQLSGLASASISSTVSHSNQQTTKLSSSSRISKQQRSYKKGGAEDDVKYDPNGEIIDTFSDDEDEKISSNKDNAINATQIEQPVIKALTNQFFPSHPLTGQTCLIATLQPGSGSAQQHIEIIAKASKGTGREHARFSPVSQCSYEYSLDDNKDRIREMFESWLINAKKASGVEKGSERYLALEREFNTMQIKRCYKRDPITGEPYSYDFTIESIGVLSVDYIVERACEVGENMCSRYVNLQKGTLPEEITISNANCRLVGYDFLFRGHDHTLGNLLQTWIVQNLIEGDASTKVTYAGFSVPHPLRDEMVLRIGVEDGEEETARAAIAAAAKGCVSIFQDLRRAWLTAIGAPLPPTLVGSTSSVASSAAPRKSFARPRSSAPPKSVPRSKTASTSFNPSLTVTKL